MDIPLLIQKEVEYKVANINKLWHNTFTIDILQSLLPTNQFMFKGLNLSSVFEEKASKYNKGKKTAKMDSKVKLEGEFENNMI